MAYFKCDGSAIDLGSNAYQCSAGWLLVDEPTFTLVSQEQASDLIVAVILLWGLVRLFGLLLSLLGVSR